MASATSTNHHNGHHVKVVDVCKITPPTNSPESNIKLTFFDILWLKIGLVQRINYYQLSESTSVEQYDPSSILRKLKTSLSHTLTHFQPLAGSITWDPSSQIPVLIYDPKDADAGVSLTVAESDADMTLLAGDSPRAAAESHLYLPELLVTDDKAAVIALQITFFPKSSGFSLGFSLHHGVLDGMSLSMFLKAWASVCRGMLMRSESEGLMIFSNNNMNTNNNNNNNTNNNELFSPLPEELTPCFDRSAVTDPEGFGMAYLNFWIGANSKSPASGLDILNTRRSLRLLTPPGDFEQLVRATFVLSAVDIKKLRAAALSQVTATVNDNGTAALRLSTFTLAAAYVFVCIVRAKGLEEHEKVGFGFMADLRSRLDPPLPENYFGNCVLAYTTTSEARQVMARNGMCFVAERISKSVRALERSGEALKGAKDLLDHFFEHGITRFGVAGSPKLKSYEADFGWGRPLKVEITSIDRSGAISILESRDGHGGVEIGLALKQHEMKLFQSLFLNGLNGI